MVGQGFSGSMQPLLGLAVAALDPTNTCTRPAKSVRMSGGCGAWSDSPYRDNGRCLGGAAGWSGHVGLRESRRGLGQPDVSDDAAPGQGDAGAAAPPTLTDSAVLAGGSSPTGTITFTLFVNGGGTPATALTNAGSRHLPLSHDQEGLAPPACHSLQHCLP